MIILKQIGLFYYVVETTEKEPLNPIRYPVRKVMSYYDIPAEVLETWYNS